MTGPHGCWGHPWLKRPLAPRRRPSVGAVGLPTGQVGLFLGVKERAVAVCCSYQVAAEDGAQVRKAARRRQNALSSALAQAQVQSRCRRTWRVERVSFPAMCKIA